MAGMPLSWQQRRWFLAAVNRWCFPWLAAGPAPPALTAAAARIQWGAIPHHNNALPFSLFLYKSFQIVAYFDFEHVLLFSFVCCELARGFQSMPMCSAESWNFLGLCGIWSFWVWACFYSTQVALGVIIRILVEESMRSCSWILELETCLSRFLWCIPRACSCFCSWSNSQFKAYEVFERPIVI